MGDAALALGRAVLPQLVTVDEVAAALAVDERTVRRLVARGELRADSRCC